jgi:hypothetical protein
MPILHPLIANRHPRDAHILALRNMRLAYWFWMTTRNRWHHEDMRANAMRWAREARKALPAATGFLP